MPGNGQDFPAGEGFELAPGTIGAAEKRHVGRIFEIGQPNDTAFAKGRAAGVARFKAVKADDTLAATGAA
jgi:hypothetical protein